VAGAARFGFAIALWLIRRFIAETWQFEISHLDLNQRVKGPELEAAGSPNERMFEPEKPKVKKKSNYINRLELE
jgi:hypothetical protein